MENRVRSCKTQARTPPGLLKQIKQEPKTNCSVAVQMKVKSSSMTGPLARKGTSPSLPPKYSMYTTTAARGQQHHDAVKCLLRIYHNQSLVYLSLQCVPMHMCDLDCGGQRLTLAVFLNGSPSHSFRQGLSVNRSSRTLQSWLHS